VCRAEGQETLTLRHFRTACVLERLDDLGLGPTERKYLRALADGATRLNVIASMLGLPARTLSAVVEPFLLRAGLIYKDDDGRRQMTALGKEHLGKSCPEPVQVPSG
jgi:Holliday junction DNA helicase RuvB